MNLMKCSTLSYPIAIRGRDRKGVRNKKGKGRKKEEKGKKDHPRHLFAWSAYINLTMKEWIGPRLGSEIMNCFILGTLVDFPACKQWVFKGHASFGFGYWNAWPWTLINIAHPAALNRDGSAVNKTCMRKTGNGRGINWHADDLIFDFETYPNYQKLSKFTNKSTTAAHNLRG